MADGSKSIKYAKAMGGFAKIDRLSLSLEKAHALSDILEAAAASDVCLHEHSLFVTTSMLGEIIGECRKLLESANIHFVPAAEVAHV